MATRQGLICRAKSSKTGLPCRKYAILGGTVCRVHGGSTRHVREAARERLEAMILPALATLRRVVTSGESDTVALAAARDILDRTGFKIADLIAVDNQVSITVSYADLGPAPPPPGHATASTNGHALGDGH